MHILLVDDEIELTNALSVILTQEGYRVDVAKEGKKAIELVNQQEYDLLILDWMLPQQSGIEICRQLRRQGKATPVLFLTAKDTIDDRVMGLDAGADDYLVKPFELRELLARVRALLRRSPNFEAKMVNKQQKVKVADLELDLENQLAYRRDRVIRLSDKEINLLKFFMDHEDQLVTHEQIYQSLWQEDEQPSSNVIAALVRLLRRKIEAKGEFPLIHTVYGRGYRFGEFS